MVKQWRSFQRQRWEMKTTCPLRPKTIPPTLTLTLEMENGIQRYFLFFIFCTLLSQLAFCPPVGNSGRFRQGKPAATESRYPTLINDKVHAGYFRVSVIHRTRTWTTGSLTCSTCSFLCSTCTHRGSWAHRQRVATTFLTRKNDHKFFLCSS